MQQAERYHRTPSTRLAKMGMAAHVRKVATLATAWPASLGVAAGSDPGCGHRGSLTWTIPAAIVVTPAIRVRRPRPGDGVGIIRLDAPSATNPGIIHGADGVPRAASPLM